MRAYLETGADISPCGEYRYALWRRLGMGERAVAFVGLNPSTADGSLDDPTIRRCVGFALAWGYDWLYMLNLHAFRSTDPRALATEIDPVGPGNWEALQRLTQKADLVIAAWGANELHGAAREYAQRIMEWPRTRCLGTTKAGAPRHPLYLPKTSQPQPVASCR